ncbi:rod shape-determining protein MreC [Suicoccus acidiformans]|uniref:Cell shape-determining protein MreC n=1 Tax=Suicoccus acidiformans TaxID=2036206 RepID=A0A347WJX0_9LACT|nr:rod shape-determining protein MreC [Suicoccus acidiformans]AXY25377.1 rod shape-determining protein MreC [Suicoccus acidiformans]
MVNNKRLIGILIGAIIVVSLMAFTLFGGGTGPVGGAVNDAGSWVGRIFSAPVNGVVRFVDSIDELLNTFEENQTLKKNIDKIDEMQVRIADLETENEKMRQELDLAEVLSDFDTLNATVISRNPDQWMETFTINVGRNHGVTQDMAVMAGNGLIGRIVEVAPTSSKVLLLTSQQGNAGKIAARIQTQNESSANGIISGYNQKNGHYIMTQVDPAAEIAPGDMVITSGLGGTIPSSLLIGEVESAYMDEYGLFQIVEVKPSGELTDIRFVTVIQRAGQVTEVPEATEESEEVSLPQEPYEELDTFSVTEEGQASE